MSTRHIQELIYQLPLAQITGGSMDFRKVSQEDREKIKHCAGQLHETFTSGLEGLGHIMWAAAANEDAGMVEDAWCNVSCLIYSIAGLIRECESIERTVSDVDINGVL